jgi:GGDEF domain-containing protein
MGGLSDKEHSVLVGKINHFKNTFNNFSDATADALLEYLKNKGKIRRYQTGE